MFSALPPTPDIACGVHDYLLIYRHTLPALAVAAAPSNSAGLVHRLLPHLLTAGIVEVLHAKLAHVAEVIGGPGGCLGFAIGGP